MSLAIEYWDRLDGAAQDALLKRPGQKLDTEIRTAVRNILERVRAEGDAAVRSFTVEFDGIDLESLAVETDELEQAIDSLGVEAVAAMDVAIDNVRRFHEAQLPEPIAVETMVGVRCERVSHPLDAVGLYVPAGTAPLPSAAIMLAVPAAIAGCPTRILCTPPGADGKADPAVVVAAHRAGVDRVYKVGGAQAVAAMAYGTESIPAVAKIFGPGNAWVTAAKSLVSADADGAAIDMPAGPSEVLVIADDGASPEFVASDLLSQAEHGIDSQVILVTTSAGFAARVSEEVERQLAALSRRTIAAQSIANSRAIVVGTADEAVRVSNRYAPEHLILQTRDPRGLLGQIRNAGSVFVGAWTPESVGDYCSGTNHVLPTYGYARSYSGLGIDQFMRHMTIQELSRDGLAGLGDAVVTLAGLEGLDGHANAVTCRLRSRS